MHMVELLQCICKKCEKCHVRAQPCPTKPASVLTLSKQWSGQGLHVIHMGKIYGNWWWNKLPFGPVLILVMLSRWLFFKNSMDRFWPFLDILPPYDTHNKWWRGCQRIKNRAERTGWHNQSLVTHLTELKNVYSLGSLLVLQKDVC